MSLPLKEESLVIIEKYMSTIHVIMMLSVKEDTLSVAHRMSEDILANW